MDSSRIPTFDFTTRLGAADSVSSSSSPAVVAHSGSHMSVYGTDVSQPIVKSITPASRAHSAPTFFDKAPKSSRNSLPSFGLPLPYFGIQNAVTPSIHPLPAFSGTGDRMRLPSTLTPAVMDVATKLTSTLPLLEHFPGDSTTHQKPDRSCSSAPAVHYSKALSGYQKYRENSKSPLTAATDDSSSKIKTSLQFLPSTHSTALRAVSVSKKRKTRLSQQTSDLPDFRQLFPGGVGFWTKTAAKTGGTQLSLNLNPPIDFRKRNFSALNSSINTTVTSTSKDSTTTTTMTTPSMTIGSATQRMMKQENGGMPMGGGFLDLATTSAPTFSTTLDSAPTFSTMANASTNGATAPTFWGSVGSNLMVPSAIAPMGMPSGRIGELPSFGGGRDSLGMPTTMMSGMPMAPSLLSTVSDRTTATTKTEDRMQWGLAFFPQSSFPPSIPTGLMPDGGDTASVATSSSNLDLSTSLGLLSSGMEAASPPKKKRQRRSRKQSSFDTDALNVRGDVTSGYRMILAEPAHKDMLSCHQCKNKKKLKDVIICGHVYMVRRTMKTCSKKYCKSCLLRFYLESPTDDVDDAKWPEWRCPCCRFICCCAWCRKKKAKRLEHASGCIRANAHRLTPATSLARKLVSETGFEEVPPSAEAMVAAAGIPAATGEAGETLATAILRSAGVSLPREMLESTAAQMVAAAAAGNGSHEPSLSHFHAMHHLLQ